MRFIFQRVISEERFMQRGYEPLGQEEFLIFNVGLGVRSLTQRSLRAQRNYRCRSVGRWPYFVPRLRDCEGHGIGLAEL